MYRVQMGSSEKGWKQKGDRKEEDRETENDPKCTNTQ